MMRIFFQGVAATAIIATLLGFAPAVRAQPNAQGANKAPSVRSTEMKPAGKETVKDQLTEARVMNFIAVQKDLAALGEQFKAMGDRPDPALQDKLDEVARRNGFANFSEAEYVRTVISLTMAHLDPGTGIYRNPTAEIEKEIDEVRRDQTLPKAERESILKELIEARNALAPGPYLKENVEIVRKRLKDIEQVLQ